MKTVVANLKMNMNLEDCKNYLDKTKGKIDTGLNVIICPSFLYLNLFKSDEFKVGAQNCYKQKEGSFTGEVSPYQLKSINVDYVILGHSERRKIFNENDKLIAEKVIETLKNNIKPIICIGETTSERDLKKTDIVIKKQLLEALKYIDSDMINDIFIAYEPVWAIGTGNIPSLNDIEEIVNYIKEIVNNKYNKNIKVLYGGSINNENIQEIITLNNIDGVLIGNASLNPDGFIKLLDQIIETI